MSFFSADQKMQEELNLAVIGLGYVGLPLAIEFAKTRTVVAYDVDRGRVEALKSHHDATGEVAKKDLEIASGLKLTSNPELLSACDCFIVTVPTPIDEYNQPDLSCLRKANAVIGKILKPGDIVIYESTVYPGCTEEESVPLLENISQLEFNKDFFCGYSPERINPGDTRHRLTEIVKVTSGSTPEVAQIVNNLYASIIRAGTHLADSIKVAEAAKVIENTQRDLNIALVNELAIILNKLDIDTESVLEAAETKWNFLSFRPGLVGGHCIGVDPYYLTHKAQAIGYNPEIILAGRRLNDNMGVHVAKRLSVAMLEKNIPMSGARILILGFSFKENCPDLRNTRVIDIVRSLEMQEATVDVFDPNINSEDAKVEYGVLPIETPLPNFYDAIVIAVAHEEFRQMGEEQIRMFGREIHILYDLKYVLPKESSDLRI